MPHENLIEPLQRMAVRWLSFLDAHTWDWPRKLDGEPCRVYGTGFSSWGAWAQLNGALLLAETANWSDALFDNAPARYRASGQRAAEAQALLRYAVGYHSTGDFDGASGDRWGGQPRGPEEKEGYNNWHSPLWTCFMAEAMLAMEDHVSDELKQRVARAVAHDADVQASLGLFNFDGYAADDPERGKSHPESNAWKAALLTLARGMCADRGDVNNWHERELHLWASSLAMPGDEQSDERCDGKRIGDLVIGSHLAPSATVIHHRFLHPCYYVFALLPRVQAARFCARYEVNYPEAAARHEAETFARLMQVLLPGRLIYPAGKDWPRWIYGQMYLLPMLAHRMNADSEDHAAPLAALIETRQRDADASDDGSFVLHRFGNVLHRRAWQAHRFESDAAASLAQTVALLRDREPSAGRPANPAPDLPLRCNEPLAQTVYERRDTAIFAASGRACAGPTQLTVAPTSSPHLLEWRGCGTMDVRMRNFIGNSSTPRVQATDTWLNDNGHGFHAHFELGYGAGLCPAQLVGRIAAQLDAEHDRMLVHQQVVAHAHGFVDHIALHTWRIAQTVHNGDKRRLTFDGGALDVPAGHTFDQPLPGRWVCIDGALCLSLPADSEHRWHLSQPAVRQHDEPAIDGKDIIGMAWLELSVVAPLNTDQRTQPGQVLADASAVVAPAAQPVSFQVSAVDEGVRFEFDDAPARVVSHA